VALTLATWLDVRSIRSAGDVRLAVEVSAGPDAPPAEAARPPSTTVLALDVSGSMAGEPLDQVVRSVEMITAAMRPEDRLGVVAFADAASVVIEPVPMDAEGKRVVRSRVARLYAEGSTNVEAGIDRAAELGPSGVVLLSDGVPNRGAITVEDLRKVIARHRSKLVISALGYGAAHSEDVLSAIGEAGGGGYAFVPEPAACARAFARAIGAQGDVVASGVEIVVAPEDGVEVRGFVGRVEARFGRDGIVVPLGDMVPGASKIVVAELSIRSPDANRLLAKVARVELRWKTPGASETSRTSSDVTVEIADRDPPLDPEGLRRVMLACADRAREEARALADRFSFAAAAVVVRKTLAEIDRVPGFVKADGSPLAEAYELLVDEAAAYERRPSPEAYATFRKATVASRAAVVPPPPSSRGALSSRMLEHTAGEYPDAWIVIVRGPGQGRRHRLKDECVIGRSAHADVVVTSDAVSRRHAEIQARGGEFWACDLGSTNPTYVNGEPIGTAAVKLRDGDVLAIGDVELRYEEPPKG
jgi:Ca-activated chloride channel family protein